MTGGRRQIITSALLLREHTVVANAEKYLAYYCVRSKSLVGLDWLEQGFQRAISWQPQQCGRTLSRKGKDKTICGNATCCRHSTCLFFLIGRVPAVRMLTTRVHRFVLQDSANKCPPKLPGHAARQACPSLIRVRAERGQEIPRCVHETNPETVPEVRGGQLRR